METAGRFGIAPDRAANYVPDSKGTALNFQMMSEAVTNFRTCGAIPTDSLGAILKDMKQRGKRK